MAPDSPDRPDPRARLGSDPIRTIGRDELREKLERGDDVKLIMALNRWAFEAKHIPGSLHFDTPDLLYANVRPDDEVVVYCSNVDCLASVAMYRDLVGGAIGTSDGTREDSSTGRTRGCRSRVRTHPRPDRDDVAALDRGRSRRATATDGGCSGVATATARSRGPPYGAGYDHTGPAAGLGAGIGIAETRSGSRPEREGSALRARKGTSMSPDEAGRQAEGVVG